MKGKDKCKILKEIRAQIANANGIEWVVENCTHKGDCRGTCPKCESEVRALERELERRRRLGQTVIVAGLSAGIVASFTSCDALDEFIDSFNATKGDMAIEETTTTSTYPVEFDGDISGDPLPEPGEPVMDERNMYAYYIPCNKAWYRVSAEFTPELLEDIDYGDSPKAPFFKIGEIFCVEGEYEYFDMLLVNYKDQYYSIPADYLELFAEYLTDEEGSLDGGKEPSDEGDE